MKKSLVFTPADLLSDRFAICASSHFSKEAHYLGSRRGAYLKNTAYRRASLGVFVACCLLLAICFLGCELFSGPKVDLFHKISDEVDWAKAAKLTVRLAYPGSWGQGAIKTADIRKGYEFIVDFTPNTEITFSAWQAYWTSDLDKISGQPGQIGNWLDDPTLIAFKGIESLGPGEITVPPHNASGGIFKFTIHTTEPVTIVPWCRAEPRITRAEPRTSSNGEPYARTSDIVLYFNGALDTGTVQFADTENSNGIWITAKSLDDQTIINTNKTMNWYSVLEYSDKGFFTVTMSPRILPPENSLMTIKVSGIKNEQGNPMDGVYTFSWKTKSSANVTLDSWKAVYAHNANTNIGSINIDPYTTTGADEVKTYYRLNKGSKTPFSGSIDNVPGPDASGVREGSPVSGIREYEILIELYAQGVMEGISSFKIWNIPGMEVSDTNPAVEIRTAAELAAMGNNLGGQYVLANDITLVGWTPVGTATITLDYWDEDNWVYIPGDVNYDNAFTGKLCGNGHKITIDGFNTANGGEAAFTGLFGVADGAEIRDITLAYSGSITGIPSAGDFYAGGIAGCAVNTVIRNVITTGVSGAALTVTYSGEGTVRIGGIVGYIEGSGIIENCRAALSTKYTSSGYAGCIGAIAGEAGVGNGKSITIDIGYTNPNGTGPKVTLDGLIIGGVLGFIKNGTTYGTGSTTVTNCFYEGKGDLSVNFSRGSVGGFLGCSKTFGTIFNNCGTLAGTIDVKFYDENEYPNQTSLYCGGFAGLSQGEISYCFSKVNIITKGVGEQAVGGFVGYANSFIRSCYAAGDVTVTQDGTTDAYVGGLVGKKLFIFDENIKNCYALENVKVTVTKADGTATPYAGGLVGASSPWDLERILYSFSAGSVEAHDNKTTNGSAYAYGVGSGAKNTVALGNKITVTAGSKLNLNAFRIGDISSSSNNYAIDSMRLYKDYYANRENPALVSPPYTGDKNGTDVTVSRLKERSFWDHRNLDFNEDYWLFTTVGTKGYPILRSAPVNGVPGPAMAGQLE